MNNEEIRREARDLLTNRWGTLAIVWLVLWAIIAITQSISFGLAPLLIGGPFALAVCTIFLKVSRREDFLVEELFDGFKSFSRSLVAYLLIALYVFLWSLLLIVPGIIAAIGYAMTFFIMAEDPKIEAEQALKLSQQMMYGHKTEYFMLMLSFIGWFLLACLTFGIGFFFLQSYTTMASLIFYQRIKAQSIVQSDETPVL
ncbi:MAG TPA: DUF975 family protein [Candidatus Syntrophosphaera sp.]|nr:DUF975 family protein [Candidatus Syntrophosphaera sp.]